MGGINIYCGSFVGEDKSGSAFESVLREISGEGEDVSAVVSRIDASLETAGEYVLIDVDDARILLGALRNYREKIVGLMGSDDPWVRIAKEERDLSRRIDPDESLGWKLYCARNLISACETSVAEREPVALVW